MEVTKKAVNLGQAADFDAVVLKSSEPVLVDFYADWCGPCRLVPPLLDELAASTERSLRIVKVDVQAMPDLAARYNVMGIPTLLLFHGGEVVDREVGVPSLQRLREMVENL